MRVSLSDANERHVEFRLNNAMSADEWILVENLHLGKETWLQHLTRRLIRLHEPSGVLFIIVRIMTEITMTIVKENFHVQIKLQLRLQISLLAADYLGFTKEAIKNKLIT